MPINNACSFAYTHTALLFTCLLKRSPRGCRSVDRGTAKERPNDPCMGKARFHKISFIQQKFEKSLLGVFLARSTDNLVLIFHIVSYLTMVFSF